MAFPGVTAGVGISTTLKGLPGSSWRRARIVLGVVMLFMVLGFLDVVQSGYWESLLVEPWCSSRSMRIIYLLANDRLVILAVQTRCL